MFTFAAAKSERVHWNNDRQKGQKKMSQLEAGLVVNTVIVTTMSWQNKRKKSLNFFWILRKSFYLCHPV